MSASSSVDKSLKHSVLPINFLSMPSKYVHFLAAICTNQNTPSILQPVEYEGTSLEWLSSTAKCVVEKYIVPKESKDPVYVYAVQSRVRIPYMFSVTRPYVGFLYTDLKRLIRYDKGVHIIRLEHSYFLAPITRTTLQGNLLWNLQATYPKHIAYIVTHNRTVNM